MPSFISNKGKWSPAKERIGLTNKSETNIVFNGKTIAPGEPFVYEGPDREALKMLHDQKVDSLGQDFRHDPEFRQAVRNQGFTDVNEYLKYIGYDEEADEKKFKERMASFSAHEIPQRVKEINIMGGGRDTSGNKANDSIGGFGDERQRSPEELKEKPKEGKP